jgi:hypothetical protein|tara:strand:- start:773 stop:1033 length:261 start_codon:yes stop_codon:yes gene_type:complete
MRELQLLACEEGLPAHFMSLNHWPANVYLVIASIKASRVLLSQKRLLVMSWTQSPQKLLETAPWASNELGEFGSASRVGQAIRPFL